jgi:hypothetical protein
MGMHLTVIILTAYNHRVQQLLNYPAESWYTTDSSPISTTESIYSIIRVDDVRRRQTDNDDGELKMDQHKAANYSMYIHHHHLLLLLPAEITQHKYHYSYHVIIIIINSWRSYTPDEINTTLPCMIFSEWYSFLKGGIDGHEFSS